jgi:Ca2+-binding EF-hand superfamily protein
VHIASTDYIGTELSEDEIRNLMGTVDTDKNGGISFKEFKSLMSK